MGGAGTGGGWGVGGAGTGGWWGVGGAGTGGGVVMVMVGVVMIGMVMDAVDWVWVVNCCGKSGMEDSTMGDWSSRVCMEVDDGASTVWI